MTAVRPKISIIVATYNRSNVLRFAIASVLSSTFDDWELIVVGDCCSDDSGEVVRSFNDSRIHWHNLERNFGEQSGPNNVGFELSRGEYICYLNHDDLYFPDHLATSLETIQRTGADLVFAALGVIVPSNDESWRNGVWQCKINNASPTGSYEHYLGCPASSWMVRREICQRHPWPAARDCHDAPSQNLLTMFAKAGYKMVFKPRLTALAIQSGNRANVYRDRISEENECLWLQMRDHVSFREELLNDLAIRISAEQFAPRFGEFLQLLYRRTLAIFGLRPHRITNVIKYRRRGEFINHLRRKRGLEPLPARNADERLGTEFAARSTECDQ